MSDFYYKTKDGKSRLHLLQELKEKDVEDFANYIQITKEEYDNLTMQKPIQRNKYIEEIKMLKQKLAQTDYQAIKYAEGELSEEEYAPTKAQRKQWRQEINELEEQIKNLNEK